jgi:hypothetical protein
MKEIRSRYRELSKIYHPDKETGNEKKFMRIAKAYAAYVDFCLVCYFAVVIYATRGLVGCLLLNSDLPTILASEETAITYAPIFDALS